jgi:trk system potassium uptake protein TrkA
VHIVVVGCGRVGSELSVSLQQAGHTVSIIDRDKRAFEKRLPEDWTGTNVVGSGFDRDVLAAAGLAGASALVAVTSGDNTNILAARIARETYEVEHVVARIYDPRRAVIYQRLGIPTVATVSWTTDQIMRKLFPEQVAPEWTDPSGTISVVQRPLPAAWAGRKLGGLDELDRFHLVALTRDGVTVLALPDLVGQEGDTLFLSVRKDALEELSTRLHGTDAVPGHH